MIGSVRDLGRAPAGSGLFGDAFGDGVSRAGLGAEQNAQRNLARRWRGAGAAWEGKDWREK